MEICGNGDMTIEEKKREWSLTRDIALGHDNNSSSFMIQSSSCLTKCHEQRQKKHIKSKRVQNQNHDPHRNQGHKS
jgi:hypothetical protein